LKVLLVTGDSIAPSLVQLSLNRQTKASFTYNWRTDALCGAIASLAEVAGSISGIFEGVSSRRGGISRRSLEGVSSFLFPQRSIVVMRTDGLGNFRSPETLG
jgi:hypothetical protein